MHRVKRWFRSRFIRPGEPTKPQCDQKHERKFGSKRALLIEMSLFPVFPNPLEPSKCAPIGNREPQNQQQYSKVHHDSHWLKLETGRLPCRTTNVPIASKGVMVRPEARVITTLNSPSTVGLRSNV